MSEAVQKETDAVPRHFLRNYLAHSLEGGLFMGGLGFISATTVLPTVIKNLHGPSWLISLMPVMMPVGVLLPPILTAHVIDRLRRYMPLLLVTGVFQRLPYLLAAAALLYAAEASPTLALAAAALAPLVAGIFCGVSFTAWQQLLIRTIPPKRRSSLFAVRSIICCGLGLFAGWVVRTLLHAYPGPDGYGLLHLCTFGALAASYVVFTMIREPAPAPAPTNARLGLRENLRGIPRLVARDRRLGLYLLSISLMNGIYILLPFLAIHARQAVGRGESYLGDLLIVQMAGAVVGNLLSGYLGDRIGGKIVLLVSRGVFVLVAAWSAVAASDWAFRAIFFAFGLGHFALMIGDKTLALELCPTRQRSTYLAVMAFVKMATMLIATAVSGAIWNGGRRFGLLAALTVATVSASLALLVPVREPRKDLVPGRAGAPPERPEETPATPDRERLL
jgi:MFS family permease